jgi:hypothetical protein
MEAMAKQPPVIAKRPAYPTWAKEGAARSSADRSSEIVKREPTRLLTRSDVEHLLDGPTCIGAVEDAFGVSEEGLPVSAGVLGLAVFRGRPGGCNVRAVSPP